MYGIELSCVFLSTIYWIEVGLQIIQYQIWTQCFGRCRLLGTCWHFGIVSNTNFSAQPWQRLKQIEELQSEKQLF